MIETQRGSVSQTLVYTTEAISSKAHLARRINSVRQPACFSKAAQAVSFNMQTHFLRSNTAYQILLMSTLLAPQKGSL